MELKAQASVLPNPTVPDTEPLRLSFPSEKGKKKFSETFKYGRVRLRKRCDSGTWYGVYTHPRSGEVVERTLGTNLKKEAIARADDWSAQLTNGTMSVADGSFALSRLIEDYFDAKDGRIKAKSHKRLFTTKVRFMAWLVATHPEVRLVKHLTPGIVRDFQKHRKSSGLSLRTVNNDIKNMHTIFRWGIKGNLVIRSPFDYSEKTGTVDLYTLPPSLIDVYTEAEYLALVAEAAKQNLVIIRDLIVVFAGTGMRFEELAHLRLKNIRWDTPIPSLEVRAQDGWSPKDPREVKYIPMLPEVQEVVRRRLAGRQDSEAFLFTNTVDNKVHEGWTLKKLKGLFSAVGINAKRRLFWHSFRNYFIIRCLKKGVAVPAIMRWTGHDSASMVLHYARVIRGEEVDAEFGKLS